MKIAITQRQTTINNNIYDCLEQGWYHLFRRHEIIVVPNLINIDLDVDMLVLSGGDYSSQRFQTEVICYNYANKYNLPILGVCHGAFFLNYLYDGINKSIEGHRNVEHEIIMENSLMLVNSYHEEAIYTLGDGLKPIAYADDSIEGFKHETNPVWGLVWHPERMEIPVLPTELLELINA
jgi:putative glutamine amidotransferase